MSDVSTIQALIEQQGRAFEAFKAEYDLALADVRKGNEDVVRSEKVDRINDEVSKLQGELDKVNSRIAAVIADPGEMGRPKKSAAVAAFELFFRKGDESGIHAAATVGGPTASPTAEDGGYLAPVEWDRTITDKLKTVSPFRQIATVQPVSGQGFSKLYNDRATASGWVGEQDARPETTTAKFKELRFAFGEIYANPAASQRLLDDAEISVESWLADEVQTEFAYQEGVAFVNGNGTNKPRGILQYAGTSPAIHPWGAIPTVVTGVAADLKLDGLIDLVYDLPSERTPNARFIMNRKTQGRIRKVKDGNANYIWQPGLQAGQPATILGFPVTEIAAMPDVQAGAVPIVFGDFSGYLILDRYGIRILRDPYTNKPFVQFYTTKRVGGGVTDPEKFRYHKVAAA